MGVTITPAPPSEQAATTSGRGVMRTLPRSVAITAVVVVFVSLLAVAAYVSSGFTPDAAHETGDRNQVATAIHEGGAIINTTGGQLESYALPEKTIALTFA